MRDLKSRSEHFLEPFRAMANIVVTFRARSEQWSSSLGEPQTSPEEEKTFIEVS